MYKTNTQGNWNEQKGNLKQKYDNITDLDSMFEEGTKEEIIKKRRIKFGKTSGDRNI